MKSFLAAVGGIALVLMVFAGGIAVGRTFFIAEPEAPPVLNLETDTDVWTSEPRTVDTAAQDFERLPAVDAPNDVNTDGEARTAGTDAADDEALIDRTSTASIQSDDDAIAAFDDVIQPPDDAAQAIEGVIQPPGDDAQPATSPEAAEMAAAHREWCSSRYRSYRPEDDSYTSYSGENRRCVSPYSDVLVEADSGIQPPAGNAEASFGEMSEASAATAEYETGPAGAGVNMTVEHVEDCFRRYRSYRMSDNTYQPYGGGPRKQCL